MDVTKIRFSPKKVTSMSLFLEKHRFSVTMSCATSLKNLVLHGKFVDWVMGIEGEHPSLGPLWLFGRLGPTGPLGLLKTVETMEGVRGS